MISPESSRSHISTCSILQEGCAVKTFNYCSSAAESAGDSDIAAAITCPESVWSRGAGARLRHRHHRRLVPAARHRGPDLPPHQELRRSARRSSLLTAVAVSKNVSRHNKGKDGLRTRRAAAGTEQVMNTGEVAAQGAGADFANGEVVGASASPTQTMRHPNLIERLVLE